MDTVQYVGRITNVDLSDHTLFVEIDGNIIARIKCGQDKIDEFQNTLLKRSLEIACFDFDLQTYYDNGTVVYADCTRVVLGEPNVSKEVH